MSEVRNALAATLRGTGLVTAGEAWDAAQPILDDLARRGYVVIERSALGAGTPSPEANRERRAARHFAQHLADEPCPECARSCPTCASPMRHVRRRLLLGDAPGDICRDAWHTGTTP